MKLGFSYKFIFYLLLIVVLAYIALKYINVIEGNARSPPSVQDEVVDPIPPPASY